MDKIQVVKIKENFIELKALLKYLDYVSSGGETKLFLLNNKILIDDIPAIGRGQKIYLYQIVKINDKRFKIIPDNEVNDE